MKTIFALLIIMCLASLAYAGLDKVEYVYDKDAKVFTEKVTVTGGSVGHDAMETANANLRGQIADLEALKAKGLSNAQADVIKTIAFDSNGYNAALDQRISELSKVVTAQDAAVVANPKPVAVPEMIEP